MNFPLDGARWSLARTSTFTGLMGHVLNYRRQGTSIYPRVFPRIFLRFLSTTKLTELTASQRGSDQWISFSHGYFTNLLVLRLGLSLLRWVCVGFSQLEYKMKLKDKIFSLQHIPKCLGIHIPLLRKSSFWKGKTKQPDRWGDRMILLGTKGTRRFHIFFSLPDIATGKIIE